MPALMQRGEGFGVDFREYYREDWRGDEWIGPSTSLHPHQDMDDSQPAASHTTTPSNGDEQLPDVQQLQTWHNLIGPKLRAIQQAHRQAGVWERYTVEHLLRLQQFEARRPWQGFKCNEWCKKVHPPGCTTCKTCHFCRQKTTDTKPACTRCRRVYWCGACLRERMGQNIDEILHNALGQRWVCPVCLDLCNCSGPNCIRGRKGWEPTHQLAHEAQACGFLSVAHYLVKTQLEVEGVAAPIPAVATEDGVSIRHRHRPRDKFMHPPGQPTVNRRLMAAQIQARTEVQLRAMYQRLGIQAAQQVALPSGLGAEAPLNATLGRAEGGGLPLDPTGFMGLGSVHALPGPLDDDGDEDVDTSSGTATATAVAPEGTSLPRRSGAVARPRPAGGAQAKLRARIQAITAGSLFIHISQQDCAESGAPAARPILGHQQQENTCAGTAAPRAAVHNASLGDTSRFVVGCGTTAGECDGNTHRLAAALPPRFETVTANPSSVPRGPEPLGPFTHAATQQQHLQDATDTVASWEGHSGEFAAEFGHVMGNVRPLGTILPGEEGRQAAGVAGGEGALGRQAVSDAAELAAQPRAVVEPSYPPQQPGTNQQRAQKRAFEALQGEMATAVHGGLPGQMSHRPKRHRLIIVEQWEGQLPPMPNVVPPALQQEHHSRVEAGRPLQVGAMAAAQAASAMHTAAKAAGGAGAGANAAGQGSRHAQLGGVAEQPMNNSVDPETGVASSNHAHQPLPQQLEPHIQHSTAAQQDTGGHRTGEGPQLVSTGYDLNAVFTTLGKPAAGYGDGEPETGLGFSGESQPAEPITVDECMCVIGGEQLEGAVAEAGLASESGEVAELDDEDAVLLEADVLDEAEANGLQRCSTHALRQMMQAALAMASCPVSAGSNMAEDRQQVSTWIGQAISQFCLHLSNRVVVNASGGRSSTDTATTSVYLPHDAYEWAVQLLLQLARQLPPGDGLLWTVRMILLGREETGALDLPASDVQAHAILLRGLMELYALLLTHGPSGRAAAVEVLQFVLSLVEHSQAQVLAVMSRVDCSPTHLMSMQSFDWGFMAVHPPRDALDLPAFTAQTVAYVKLCRALQQVALEWCLQQLQSTMGNSDSWPGVPLLEACCTHTALVHLLHPQSKYVAANVRHLALLLVYTSISLMLHPPQPNTQADAAAPSNDHIAPVMVLSSETFHHVQQRLLPCLENLVQVDYAFRATLAWRDVDDSVHQVNRSDKVECLAYAHALLWKGGKLSTKQLLEAACAPFPPGRSLWLSGAKAAACRKLSTFFMATAVEAAPQLIASSGLLADLLHDWLWMLFDDNRGCIRVSWQLLVALVEASHVPSEGQLATILTMLPPDLLLEDRFVRDQHARTKLAEAVMHHLQQQPSAKAVLRHMLSGLPDVIDARRKAAALETAAEQTEAPAKPAHGVLSPSSLRFEMYAAHVLNAVLRPLHRQLPQQMVQQDAVFPVCRDLLLSVVRCVANVFRHHAVLDKEVGQDGAHVLEEAVLRDLLKGAMTLVGLWGLPSLWYSNAVPVRPTNSVAPGTNTELLLSGLGKPLAVLAVVIFRVAGPVDCLSRESQALKVLRSAAAALAGCDSISVTHVVQYILGSHMQYYCSHAASDTRFATAAGSCMQVLYCLVARLQESRQLAAGLQLLLPPAMKCCLAVLSAAHRTAVPCAPLYAMLELLLGDDPSLFPVLHDTLLQHTSCGPSVTSADCTSLQPLITGRPVTLQCVKELLQVLGRVAVLAIPGLLSRAERSRSGQEQYQIASDVVFSQACSLAEQKVERELLGPGQAPEAATAALTDPSIRHIVPQSKAAASSAAMVYNEAAAAALRFAWKLVRLGSNRDAKLWPYFSYVEDVIVPLLSIDLQQLNSSTFDELYAFALQTYQATKDLDKFALQQRTTPRLMQIKLHRRAQKAAAAVATHGQNAALVPLPCSSTQLGPAVQGAEMGGQHGAAKIATRAPMTNANVQQQRDAQPQHAAASPGKEALRATAQGQHGTAQLHHGTAAGVRVAVHVGQNRKGEYRDPKRPLQQHVANTVSAGGGCMHTSAAAWSGAQASEQVLPMHSAHEAAGAEGLAPPQHLRHTAKASEVAAGKGDKAWDPGATATGQLKAEADGLSADPDVQRRAAGAAAKHITSGFVMVKHEDVKAEPENQMTSWVTVDELLAAGHAAEHAVDVVGWIEASPEVRQSPTGARVAVAVLCGRQESRMKLFLPPEQVNQLQLHRIVAWRQAWRKGTILLAVRTSTAAGSQRPLCQLCLAPVGPGVVCAQQALDRARAAMRRARNTIVLS